MIPNQPARKVRIRARGYSGPLQLVRTSSQGQTALNAPLFQLYGPRSVESSEPLSRLQISSQPFQIRSTQEVRITVFNY